MSYTSGTKLSYKSGKEDREGDSSVVVLRNGSLLEVRNGNNTFKGPTHSDRRTWATLEEWRANLPSGAAFTVSKSSSASSSSPALAPTHPDIELIKNKFREAGIKVPHYGTCVFLTIRRRQTRSEMLATETKFMDDLQEKLKAETRESHITYIKMYMPYCQGRIDKLRKEMVGPDIEPFLVMDMGVKTAFILYGGNDIHSLQGIYINGQYGKFAIKRDDGSIQMVDRLEELGLSHFLLRVGDKLVSL
jgi:hypothetical protein